MQQCPKETFARLFYNVSTSFFLLLFFFHFTSIFLAKLFIFFGGNPFYQRNQEGYEFSAFSEEEEEEEEKDVYGADVIEGKEHLAAVDMFAGNYHDSFIRDPYEVLSEENQASSDGGEMTNQSSSNGGEMTSYSTPAASEYSDEDEVDEEILAEDADSFLDSKTNANAHTTRFATKVTTTIFEANNDTREDVRELPKTAINLKHDEDFLVFHPSKSEGKQLIEEKQDEGEIYGDTFTIGSTSKDSSEWRSSINCRDSGTDDPFSSSSRRSCPKWESYTIFQKYEEEMLFLDRISAQKLHEMESVRSIQVCPRSFSERIVHKIRTRSKRTELRQNPSHEFEPAYVAQICLTWEALNWNFKYFQRLRASRRDYDPGCPAYVAQQFQQFLVLLQRYIETEPYEHGRRPEIYARLRSLAPKLLQVPEYRDSEDDRREEGYSSRIPSSSFLAIMEESIRTFMNFLKQDRKSHCQKLADLFKRKRRGSADATLLFLLKKLNKKKKAKLNEIRRRSGKCLRRRKLRAEEELEIVMALIDLKVVSRVLRMADLNGEQLNWCEKKMSKVRVSEGRLQRDSTPLFFPAH